MAVKKSSKVKKANKKQSSPKAACPEYMTVNRRVYERLSKNSKEVVVEIRADVLSWIDNLVTKGQYVSRGDAIRDMLRQSLSVRDSDNNSGE